MRATAKQRARMAKVKQLPCVACRKRGAPFQCGVTEVHHLLNSSKRRGHDFTVSLCTWHHRAVPLIGCTSKAMTDTFGPSLRLASKKFHEVFGDDDSLLAETNRLLGAIHE